MNQTYVFKRSATDPRHAAPALAASFTQQFADYAPGFADNRTVQTMVNRVAADANLTLVKAVRSADEILITTDELFELQDNGSSVSDQNGSVDTIARVIAGAVIFRPAAGGACYGTVNLGIKSRATLTSNGTNPVNASTITIGGKTYTFVTTIGATEGNVLIGANATATAANLSAAINKGAGGGTVYVAAAANTLVFASVSALVITLVNKANTVGLVDAATGTYFTFAMVKGGVGPVLALPYSADEQFACFDLGGDGVALDSGDLLDIGLYSDGGVANQMTLVLFLKSA